jgi:hypothetical protein
MGILICQNLFSLLSDYLYCFENSILFYEVIFQAMSEPMRKDAPLPYQDHGK